MEYRIVLLPILLILLFCLYYSNFKSNMIIMLSLVIILVIFDLLNNTEYFDVNVNTKILNLTDSEINGILKEQSLKIDNLENMLKIVNKYKTASKRRERNLVYPSIPLNNSCIMLDSDGDQADAIPKISSGDDIYSSENPFYHSIGRDHAVYNNIMNQLTNN